MKSLIIHKYLDLFNGQRIPFAIKQKVLSSWLEGKPRNIIATESGISYGSVSNIIKQIKRESIKDIDLLRAVAVLLKENNLCLTKVASALRLKNRLSMLKLSELQVDSFLENIYIHCFKEDLDQKEFLTQISVVCSIAEYLDIPVSQLPDYLEKKIKRNNDRGHDEQINE